MEAGQARGFALQPAPLTGMLRQRVISSLILLPALLAAVYFGSPWFSLLISLVAVLGLAEFYRLASQGGWHPFKSFGVLCTLLFLYYVYRDGVYSKGLLGGVFISSLVALSFYSSINRFGFKTAVWNWVWTLGGIFYIGALLGVWIVLHHTFGWEWTMLALLTTFAVDTGAFFTGRRFGKHRLAPRISPKKTWEGAAGGLVCGTASVVLLAWVFGLVGQATPDVWISIPLELWKLFLLGVLLSVLAQLGDLAESSLKRSVDAKDASSLIPGHGGFLDRLDSILVTGILIYCYLSWMA